MSNDIIKLMSVKTNVVNVTGYSIGLIAQVYLKWFTCDANFYSIETIIASVNMRHHDTIKLMSVETNVVNVTGPSLEMTEYATHRLTGMVSGLERRCPDRRCSLMSELVTSM